MKRFFEDIKKYAKYIKYSTISRLKSEVADSFLGYIWWFLEPICFMFIYLFISLVVFKKSEPYFAVFVFIGLTIWNFFSKSVTSSVKLVSSNRDIVTKVYLPKIVLLFIQLGVNLIKMFISFGLVVILMIFFKVPISPAILNFIPLLVTLYIVTFGFCSVLMHFGVFVEDLSNLTSIALKLVFYMSGIFFAVSKRVPAPYNEILLKFNPVAYLINDFRNVLIYKTMPDYLLMILWLIIGIVLTIIGVKTIYKYENSYVKVIKG